MLIKSLILISFSLFGNVETEGVFLNGYINGVISFATQSIYEDIIVWDQMRLLQENIQKIKLSNFFNALLGKNMIPSFYTGLNISFWGSKKIIMSIYFTGTMVGLNRAIPNMLN
jgi:hypothetical protein